jgi:hypothetical protein
MDAAPRKIDSTADPDTVLDLGWFEEHAARCIANEASAPPPSSPGVARPERDAPTVA